MPSRVAVRIRLRGLAIFIGVTVFGAFAVFTGGAPFATNAAAFAALAFAFAAFGLAAITIPRWCGAELVEPQHG